MGLVAGCRVKTCDCSFFRSGCFEGLCLEGYMCAYIVC